MSQILLFGINGHFFHTSLGENYVKGKSGASFADGFMREVLIKVGVDINKMKIHM